ncbi:MAG: hypothetical protein ACE5R6_03175 [Candidatus Heimdallarchaeota archaeon]
MFPVDLVVNGTRLFLISQTKPEPDYSVKIFPEIPTIEELTTIEPTTIPSEVLTIIITPEELHRSSFLLGLGLGAIATLIVVVMVGKIVKGAFC